MSREAARAKTSKTAVLHIDGLSISDFKFSSPGNPPTHGAGLPPPRPCVRSSLGPPAPSP